MHASSCKRGINVVCSLHGVNLADIRRWVDRARSGEQSALHADRLSQVGRARRRVGTLSRTVHAGADLGPGHRPVSERRLERSGSGGQPGRGEDTRGLHGVDER